MRFTPAISLCCLLGSVAANAEQPAPSVEEIYVVRSLNLTRDPASPFCATERTGFPNAQIEDHFNFQSLAIDGAMVTDTNVETVGAARACFGPTEDPAVLNFYGEGTLANLSFRGRGECRIAKVDYPEPGVNITRCFLDIDGLPDEYVGGHLTSNTVSSRQTTGLISDPPGYVQPSIATIRLWKQRQPD